MSELRLNFLPLKTPLPEIEVFVKSSTQGSKDKSDYRWYPPESDPLDISFSEKATYEKRRIQLGADDPAYLHLTLHYLGRVLASNAEHYFGGNIAERRRALNLQTDLTICIETMKLGRRIMRIRPKYLHSQKTFGLVLREEYWKNQRANFNKPVLIESGSYDLKGRPNAAYHQEALKRVGQFIQSKSLKNLLSELGSPFQKDVTFGFDNKFVKIDAKVFKPRSFQVGDNHTANDSLKGVVAHGPRETVSHTVRLLFIGRESDKALSRVLYKGLIEGNDKVRPQSLFGIKLEIHPEKYLVINDFDEVSLSDLEKTISEYDEIKRKHTIAITILPTKDSNPYYQLKSLLLKNGLFSQFCTRSLISNPYSFKWALANIALGVFAKSGGVPWRVEPHDNKAVIIGVGQAVGTGIDESNQGIRKIVRHKTFSVSTDSTGEFLELNELATGETDETESYVASFQNSLKNVLTKQTESNNSADLFVVHTPFNLRRSLMNALEEAVQSFHQNHDAKFVILKFNNAADNWFGFSTENNRVPIEGTYCALSDYEYLIWFEGANRYTKQVRRRCGPPSHVRFLGETPSVELAERCLKDAYDLAGANWRGFNARGLPVSMYYCELVASFLKGFHESGEEVPSLETLHPWFL